MIHAKPPLYNDLKIIGEHMRSEGYEFDSYSDVEDAWEAFSCERLASWLVVDSETLEGFMEYLPQYLSEKHTNSTY